MRGHVKKVSIVELDHGYAVCGLKTFECCIGSIIDTNDMRYVSGSTVSPAGAVKESYKKCRSLPSLV